MAVKHRAFLSIGAAAARLMLLVEPLDSRALFCFGSLIGEVVQGIPTHILRTSPLLDRIALSAVWTAEVRRASRALTLPILPDRSHLMVEAVEDLASEMACDLLSSLGYDLPWEDLGPPPPPTDAGPPPRRLTLRAAASRLILILERPGDLSRCMFPLLACLREVAPLMVAGLRWIPRRGDRPLTRLEWTAAACVAAGRHVDAAIPARSPRFRRAMVVALSELSADMIEDLGFQFAEGGSQ